MRSQSHQSGNRPTRSLSQTSTTTSSSRSTQYSDEKKHFRLSNPIASKLRQARSKSPSPITIPKNTSSAMSSQPRDIPRSNPESSYFDQDHQYYGSETSMSPDNASLRSFKGDFASKQPTTPTRKNSDDYRRYSGTVNHCGRHSNDWLFGGFSVRDTVRDGIEKLRHHDKEG